MKKWLYIIGCSLILFFSLNIKAISKIAVVNISNIFQQLLEHENITKKIENDFKIRLKEIQNIKYQIKNNIKNLQKNGKKMQISNYKKLQKKTILQRTYLSRLIQSLKKDTHHRQIQENNKILNKIQDVIKYIANKENYDVIIDTNAIAYAISSKDITMDVLKRIK
ncbi:Chaperone protein Skp [Serratia symbiotica]|nr:Chaperone protein Skp [Serratia symbiotica]